MSRYVVGIHSRFYKYCTRTAHGVEEVGVGFPATQLYEACCQHLVDGGYSHALSVATLVERFARAVHQKRNFVGVDVDVELVVGVFGIDSWAAAKHSAKAVHYGILHLKGGVVRIGEYLAIGCRLDEKLTIDVQNLFPFNLVHIVVQLLFVVCLKLGKRFEYGQGCSAGVVGFVEGLHGSGKSHRTVYGRYVLCTQCTQLFGQYLFEAVHRFGYHLEALARRYFVYYLVFVFNYYHCRML